jgi:general secretion pathway protein L
LPRTSGATRKLVVRLSAIAVLRKHLSLPAGARWHMEKVLAFEFDRETPFAADEAYWAYAVRHHDRARGLLDVELIIVTRSEIDPLIATIRRVGGEVMGIEIPSPAGKPLFIPLQKNMRRHRLLAHRSLVGWVSVAVALVAGVIIVPFARIHFEQMADDREIAALTASAEEAGALRKAVDQSTDAGIYLSQERRRSGPVLEVLAHITDDLPDDTHLTSFSLHLGHVTIEGVAQSTAKVVSLISKDPMFADQVFDAPVVQDSSSGLESFTLSFALKLTSPS